MEHINKFISNRIKRSYYIKATDETIKEIVKDELNRLGHNADLNHIDVSEVTDMSYLFSCDYDDNLGPYYKDINPDISGWDVRKVKTMKFMFYECEKFNCDISGWDVSSVENMRGAFEYCKSFNQDLSQWDVSNVEYASYIFMGCNMKPNFIPKFKCKQ